MTFTKCQYGGAHDLQICFEGSADGWRRGGGSDLPAQFLRACINIQKCYNDDIGALVGCLFEDYESTAVKFGILIGVFIFSFLLGYCISPEND